MQDLGHPLTPLELLLKVATATQTRETPWSASGVPRTGWLRRFHSRHPEIASRRSHVACAHSLCPATAETLYGNLETLYRTHNYPPDHIWNCDESGVQASRSGGATVLARRGSRFMHSIEPDQREHLSVLNYINAGGGHIPNFYILKGIYFQEEYIANYEDRAVMGMQPNAWMTRWLFESWISHFIECLKRDPGIDLQNRHVLILDGHNSHITLEVVRISMESGLDIVSLSSHTSHALQPLDVSCFKPFKTAFRKIRDRWSLTSKTKAVDKRTLCEWTSQALQTTLTPKNIMSGFKATGIWPLDHQATKHAMKPSEGYEQRGPGIVGAKTRASGHPEAPVTSSVGHPMLDGEAVTGCSSQPHGADQRSDRSDRETCSNEDSDCYKTPPAICTPTSHVCNANIPLCHFYVDVVDVDDITYQPSEKHIPIDRDFQSNLE